MAGTQVDPKHPLLGKQAKDKVTGLEGVIGGVAMYLHGGTHVMITKLNSNGSVTESWSNITAVDVLPDSVEDTSQSTEVSASPIMPIGPE